jgi:hypothetical protein
MPTTKPGPSRKIHDCAFDHTGRDEAEGEDLVDPLDDGIEHDGRADVGDDEDQLQQLAQVRAVVGGATDDVARVVQQRSVEKKDWGIEVINVITNNTPVTLTIFWGFIRTPFVIRSRSSVHRSGVAVVRSPACPTDLRASSKNHEYVASRHH